MACLSSKTKKSKTGREECRLLFRLLWMDDNLEQTGITTTARCPNSLPRKPCRSRCGIKTKCGGHPALEVHFLGPPDHQSYNWTTGLESPCNLLVTGRKVDLQPSVRRRVSSATERASSACACTSCAVKHRPRDSKVCTKRSPVPWSSSRLCDTERKDKLFKLLNEFGEIRERSRQAKEMLRESFAARRKSLKTQWCDEQDIENLRDDLNLDEGGKQCRSICDTTLPKPDDECSNCGYSH